MKKIIYILMALTPLLLASCMGDDYAEAGYDNTPVGNNEIAETNVISIAQLRNNFNSYITTDYRDGASFTKVDTDVKIKGVVTSSDIQGNIYNELALQDETGAIIISIAQGGLYGILPPGTEVLVDLKGLCVGNYRMQASIGVSSINSNGATELGRISRATWNQHFKVLGKTDVPEPEEFANGSTATKWDINKDDGKLGVIRNVSIKFNSIDSTYYSTLNGGEIYLNEQGSNVMLYNSQYADFANAKMPSGKVDITGIMKRYNNKWEVIIRSLDDIKPAATALFEDNFDTGTGSFSIVDVKLDEALKYVWNGSSYGAKASAYLNSKNYEAESWLISPEIDLSKATSPQLVITQAANFLGSDFYDNCNIMVSTNYKSGLPSTATWTALKPSNVPTADTKWDMVTGNASLASYAGKKIRIALRYVSSASTAPTWEVRNITVK